MICGGCGAPNREGEGACAKCGQVLEEETSTEKVTLTHKIIGTLAAFAAIGILVFKVWVYPILKAEVGMEAAQRRHEQKEKERVAPKKPAPGPRVLLRNDEAPDPTPKPVAPLVPETPAPKEPAPPPPHQVEGQAHLRRADDLFARGDFPAAAEAYQSAERLAVGTPESRERRKACADIAYIVRYRDDLDRSKILDSAMLISAKANLARVEPATLPGDLWRDEFRKTQARVDKAYKEVFGEERGGQASPTTPRPPPPPKLVTDDVWKSMKMLLKPVSPDRGKIDGATFTEVGPEGLIAKAGIRVGDVLVEINDQPLTTMNQILGLRAMIDRDRGWWGVVRRGDQRVAFRVEIPGGK